jgi:hypothetical protein
MRHPRQGGDKIGGHDFSLPARIEWAPPALDSRQMARAAPAKCTPRAQGRSALGNRDFLAVRQCGIMLS